MGSWVLIDGTCLNQVVVVDPNGVFDDGSEGGGLLHSLPERLDR